MRSFLPHFLPLHVQTWIWSKSSHKSEKLFFTCSHEAVSGCLQYRGRSSSQYSCLVCMSIMKLHRAVFFCLTAAVFPRSSHQHVHQAPINQRGHRGAWAPACRAPTCSTHPSLAAPPSTTASASPAISQWARPARVSATDQSCDLPTEHRRFLLTAEVSW